MTAGVLLQPFGMCSGKEGGEMCGVIAGNVGKGGSSKGLEEERL